MKIDYIFDVVCPWCYVGKWRLQRALQLRPQIAAKIHWRPFLLNPDLPTDGLDRQAYLDRKFGSSNRVERMHAAVTAAAQSEGLEFNFDAIRWMPSTLAAHRLIHFAVSFGREDSLVEALFAAFFQQGRNIGDLDQLISIADQCGLDRQSAADYLSGDADNAQIYGENARAHRLGVNGVPCIVIDDSYALAGAQEPAVLLRLLDVARESALESVHYQG